jgi:maltose alpha-D-glucosyltransferase / alpha-amylase
MVTDEERDYMYRTFTLDAKARINLGIRRRLAPLMGNDRRKIELMNALLLSLPGTPILYYGDEIAMGDNYFLGDRNGVRTPMQWTADRNAGFSRANPQSLYLPVIFDPEYHYEFRNVEVQHANPSSLLWWTRRILDLRKQFPAFGNGSFEALVSGNPKVFAFLRETDEETLLIVTNLSRLSQYAELDLSRYRGRRPVELFGHTSFPPVGDDPYRLSLGPHGVYWFCLECRGETEDSTEKPGIPTANVRDSIEELFTDRRQKALSQALVPYLKRQRWFAGKSRTLRPVQIVDWFSLETAGQLRMYLLLARALFAEGESDLYAIPLILAEEESGQSSGLQPILCVRSNSKARAQLLCDAVGQPGFWKILLATLAQRGRVAGHHGKITSTQTSALNELFDAALLDLDPKVHGGEQSNTSALFDEQLILKLFRRVTPGINPDFEIGRQLTENQNLAMVPKVVGALEYRAESNQFTLAVLHQFVPNVGDAWSYTLDELDRYLERVQSADAHEIDTDLAPPNQLAEEVLRDAERSIVELARVGPSPLAQHVIGGFLSLAELLGRRVGELHVALATAEGGTAFAPEPFTRLYQRSLYQSMMTQARSTFGLLRSQKQRLNLELQDQVDELLHCERSLYSKFAELIKRPIHARRIRCHGDLHLGQVLFTGTDFVIIDFEGEPERPVSERRIKSSALRDVAGMLRSFHYAAHGAARGQTQSLIVQHAAVPITQWANYWSAWVSAAFLRTYLVAAEPGGFLPTERSQFDALLSAYLLEKALYELRYELNNRPDWVNIPLEGVRHYCMTSNQEVAV